MKTTTFLCLFSFAVLLATGQLLFKRVGLSMKGLPLADGLITVARSPALYAALALYGVCTILWIWILSRVSLSQAYPWVAVTITLVPLLAWFIFGERVGGMYWIGIAFVVFGVLLTQYAAPA